jgi:hypothetical protein
LLECEPRRGEPGTGARWTHRVLTHESLQMLVRRRAVAARLFQLGQREQRVVRVRRQCVFHDYASVIALCIGRRLREGATPVERIAVGRRPFGSRTQHRVDERATGRAVSFAHQSARAVEDGIAGRKRWTRRRASVLRTARDGERCDGDEREQGGTGETLHRDER